MHFALLLAVVVKLFMKLGYSKISFEHIRPGLVIDTSQLINHQIISFGISKTEMQRIQKSLKKRLKRQRSALKKRYSIDEKQKKMEDEHNARFSRYKIKNIIEKFNSLKVSPSIFILTNIEKDSKTGLYRLSRLQVQIHFIILKVFGTHITCI